MDDDATPEPEAENTATESTESTESTASSESAESNESTEQTDVALAPAEITYRQFTRVERGFDEAEVRAFLGEVADALARAREQQLPEDAEADADVAIANDRAARIIRRAEARAEEIAATADLDARERSRAIVAAARQARERMLEDLERNRHALRSERAHLEATRERLRLAYDRIERLLAEIRTVLADPPQPSDTPEGRAAAPKAKTRRGATAVETSGAPEVADTSVERPAPSARRGDDIGALFARVRAESDVDPLQSETSGEAAAIDVEEAPPFPEATTASTGVVPTPTDEARDQSLRDARDSAVTGAFDVALRAVKRLVQDEQNDVLDRVRRARGRLDSDRVLPPLADQVAAWSGVLRAPFKDVYAAGGRAVAPERRPHPPAAKVVDPLVRDVLVQPLRDRLTAALEGVAAEGPYDGANELHRAAGNALSARYREFRSGELETLLGDVLSAAFARGSYDGAAAGSSLRWIPAEVQQCPDADDNALEPTPKGKNFPTGQPYPPAHPGCRCLVVPT
ncbi:MAG: DivIVA domain-containing protein [Actinobacteria bacterium]|nr:MAG: DivIVA domain-containing protein [Actinomycetota bacterium]